MPGVFTSQRDLERTVRAFVATGSGLDKNRVIAGNADSPRPQTAYATVLPISDTPAAYPIYGAVEGEAGVDTMVYVRSVFSVQWYRTDAIDKARAFDLWVKSPRGLDAAERAEFLLGGTLATGERWAGLRVVVPLEIRQVDIPVGDKYERRATVDLGIDYAYAIAQDIPLVDPHDQEYDLCIDGQDEITLEVA